METNQQEASRLAWARYLNKEGLKIFPVHGVNDDNSCTCGQAGCGSIGKHPLGAGWQKSYFKSDEQIRQFWQSTPRVNFAVITSGLAVIDIDERSGGVDSYEKHIAPLFEGVQTFIVQTGSGGASRHLYFLDTNSEIKCKNGLYPGIDIKARGGYVVGPGSRHVTGGYYTALDSGGAEKGEIKIEVLPEKLKILLLSSAKPQGKPRPVGNRIFGAEVLEGTRNDTLISRAGSLHRMGLPMEEMRVLLLAYNNSFNPPLSEEEVLKVLKSVSRYPSGPQIGWSEPDLQYSIKTPSHQDISLDLLPSFFKAFVLKKEESLGVPKVAIMVSILTTISAILGAAFRVKPNEKSEYEETLNLWGLIIAPPSSRKSAVLDVFKSSLKAISSFFSQKMNEDRNLALEEISKCKIELKNKETSEEDKAKLNLKMLKLKERDRPLWCFVANDTTPEALGLLFQHNHRGILLFKDELDGLLSKFSKSGYEDFRALMCEAWSGARPYQSFRVGRGFINIESTTLSVLGGIQPDIIAAAFKEEIRKGMGGDGLLARFQLCAIYGSKDLKEPDSTVDLSIESRQMNGLLLALHELTKDFNLSNGSIDYISLHLTKEAEELFSHYVKKIRAVMSDDDVLNQAYKSHIGKLGRLVLSLSAQFYIIESVIKSQSLAGPIGVEWVKLALKWAEYMERQAEVLYFTISQKNSAKTLLSRIKNGDVKDGMSVRKIYRRGWAGISSRDDVLSAIESIEEANWVRIENDSPKGGGRKTDLVRLNPKLIEWLKLNYKKSPIGRTDKTDVRGGA